MAENKVDRRTWDPLGVMAQEWAKKEAHTAYEQRLVAAAVQRVTSHENADEMYHHIMADAREEFKERMAEIENG